MIGLSPKGVLDLIIVFPAMLLIALALDILGLLSLVGGTILNIIGIVTIGLWIILRSSGGQSMNVGEGGGKTTGKGAQTMAKEETEIAARESTEVATKSATKTAVKGASRMGGVLLRVGSTTAVEFIPVINGIFFGWTLMVVWEAISDFRNFSLEAGD